MHTIHFSAFPYPFRTTKSSGVSYRYVHQVGERGGDHFHFSVYEYIHRALTTPLSIKIEHNLGQCNGGQWGNPTQIFSRFFSKIKCLYFYDLYFVFFLTFIYS
uniref:Uncharacterized protein n=1 Tax=Cacopsylla melanoneura TaxID=428564 RepID=A0A8D9BG26_9HEMI